MFSRCLSLCMLCFIPASARVLRVCADPNNLPFSNQAGEGFENKLAQLLAKDIGASLEYFWWPERKAFVDKTLNQGRCDVWMGVPHDLNSALTTAPYYRSTYVVVSRKDRALEINSLLDPNLEKYRIGIHIVGDDYAPPANILARRGLTVNLVGFSLFGKTGEANPPARLIEAVTRGDVDLAIVWGPFAGYFAERAQVPLVITPVLPTMFAGVPFTYDISAAVRKTDSALKAEIDAALVRECKTIRSLLDAYRIPQLTEEMLPCVSSPPVSASLR